MYHESINQKLLGWEFDMAIYKVITLIGTSTVSWEAAATFAVQEAKKSLRGMRVAEVKQLDMQVEDGKPIVYRAKIKVSFEYDPSKKD
jgi:dodecin